MINCLAILHKFQVNYYCFRVNYYCFRQHYFRSLCVNVVGVQIFIKATEKLIETLAHGHSFTTMMGNILIKIYLTAFNHWTATNYTTTKNIWLYILYDANFWQEKILVNKCWVKSLKTYFESGLYSLFLSSCDICYNRI